MSELILLYSVLAMQSVILLLILGGLIILRYNFGRKANQLITTLNEILANANYWLAKHARESVSSMYKDAEISVTNRIELEEAVSLRFGTIVVLGDLVSGVNRAMTLCSESNLARVRFALKYSGSDFDRILDEINLNADEIRDVAVGLGPSVISKLVRHYYVSSLVGGDRLVLQWK